MWCAASTYVCKLPFPYFTVPVCVKRSQYVLLKCVTSRSCVSSGNLIHTYVRTCLDDC